MESALSAFDRHLEGCAWCREHPFNLCREGKAVLILSAQEVSPLTGNPPTEKQIEAEAQLREKIYEEFGEVVKTALRHVQRGREMAGADLPYLQAVDNTWMTAWYKLQHILFGKARSLELKEPLFKIEPPTTVKGGHRACEKCKGHDQPGPVLWSDAEQRYLCENCHENPRDPFFAAKEAR